MANLLPTFIAALRSVGTACTMAGAGAYLHRKGMIANDGTRTLAIVSSQIAIPSLLFSEIIYCDQDWSDEPCPNIMDNINEVAVLVVWPIYVVICGLVVGGMAAYFAQAPKEHFNSILVAVAMGSATGLPITLLSVIHSNFPSSTSLGRIDPTAYISIYLLFYPVLQWGIGGFLTAPLEDGKEIKTNVTHKKSGLPLDAENVDEKGEGKKNSEDENLLTTKKYVQDYNSNDTKPLKCIIEGDYGYEIQQEFSKDNHKEKCFSESNYVTIIDMINTIASKSLQPPALGALIGLAIAAMSPLRGLFVDLVNRDSGAPLEWFFDGIYAVGQAAVPINMLVLGINLDKAAKTKKGSKGLMSESTMVAIVIAKMVVMPVIGILSVILLNKYVWDISDEIRAPFLLVAMIEFVTPTANNVMIMLELSGSDAKAGIAKSIGYQYAAAPILLSFSVFACVYVAVLI